ncbi:Presequence translocated-associated motor subunit PAM17 [Fusarium oxysporum f. sp. albedinis]|nr:Presequence translocated-associated motor subunit PAM17 [Fusarium oxysporum f. sp. albedinis]
MTTHRWKRVLYLATIRGTSYTFGVRNYYAGIVSFHTFFCSSAFPTGLNTDATAQERLFPKPKGEKDKKILMHMMHQKLCVFLNQSPAGRILPYEQISIRCRVSLPLRDRPRDRLINRCLTIASFVSPYFFIAGSRLPMRRQGGRPLPGCAEMNPQPRSSLDSSHVLFFFGLECELSDEFWPWVPLPARHDTLL